MGHFNFLISSFLILSNLTIANDYFEGKEKVDCTKLNSSSVIKLKFVKYRIVNPDNPNLWSEALDECSGSLIDYNKDSGKSYILTAFHCVHNSSTNKIYEPNKTKIYINTQCQNEVKTQFIAENIYIHPAQYEQITTYNLNFKPSLDYALIEVNADLASSIKKMHILKNHEEIKNLNVKKEYLTSKNANDFYLKYDIAGFPIEPPFKPGVFFNYQNIRGLYSKDLQTIPLLFKIYQGMSGGPIFLKDLSNKYYQLGVNSVYLKVINLNMQESSFKRSEATLITKEKLDSLVKVSDLKEQTTILAEQF